MPKERILKILFLSVCVVLAFSPCLKAGFLNWDDPSHARDNINVASLSATNIKAIFQTTVCRIYIPLTTLSFAVERKALGGSAAVCHATNIVLHGMVVLALFFLCLRFGLSEWAAFLVALLFGLHPVHVESVAWITERKDVLFGLFYILALYHYFGYVRSLDRWSYVWAVLFASLSILSKPMAVSLPWTLFVIDWLAGRHRSWRMLGDKIPFFGIIGLVALITFAQHGGGASISFLQSALLWLWSATFYLRVFFFPFGLGPVRLLPEPISILNPEYFTAAGILLLCLFGVWRFRKERWVVFAALFYCSTMFFLWRLDYKDIDIVAERFLYIPSLGFCVLVGVLLDRWRSACRAGGKLKIFQICVVALFILLAVKTFRQCRIWRNDRTLWTDVLKRSPRHYIALDRLSVYLCEQKLYKEALTCNQKAMAVNPGFASLHYNRGLIFSGMKNYDEAIRSFTRALEMDPNMSFAYYERGKSFSALGNEESALADFSRAIHDDHDLLGAFNERGIIFGKRGKWALSLDDFNRVLTVIPQDVPALNNRANLFRLQGQYDRALSDYGQVLRIKPQDRTALEQSAWIHYRQKDFALALERYNALVGAYPLEGQYYYARSLVFRELGKPESAFKDALQAEDQGYQVSQEFIALLKRLSGAKN